jgi:hypothetical protein
MEQTKKASAQAHVSNFEVRDGKIFNKKEEREITLQDLKAAFLEGFEFARISSEPLKSVFIGRMDIPENEEDPKETVLDTAEPYIPLSNYDVIVFTAEPKAHPPHLHVIKRGKLDVAFAIADHSILSIIEADDTDLQLLTEEVAEWLELPNKYFPTNREACFYQYNLQNGVKPVVVHKHV